MSRQLPAHPNLEHLKKQAKDRLADLQHERPDAQLADAQHEIAKTYGFTSWPKLRAHLDGLLERAGTNLIAGVWIADLSRSKQHPLQALQSAKLEIAVIGETVTIVDEIVDASGRKERHENILAADGGEHPSPHGGYQIVATWDGVLRFNVVVTKDGRVEGETTYDSSDNGGTLTVSGKSESGEQVIVFQRS